MGILPHAKIPDRAVELNQVEHFLRRLNSGNGLVAVQTTGFEIAAIKLPGNDSFAQSV